MTATACQTPADLNAGQTTETANLLTPEVPHWKGAPEGEPAPVAKTRTRKRHPPAEPRPHFEGKAKDSPYYLDPVTKLKFIEAMAEDDGLPPAGLRAAILILGHYNHREGVARPGEQSIADRLKKQRTTISEALNKVAERGWLQIIPTRIGNRNGPNHYVPVLSKAGLTFGKTGQSAAPTVGFFEDDCRVSPALTVGFSEPSLSAKPDTNLEKGTQQENQEREPGAPKGAVSVDLMDEWFDFFWEHYPRQEDPQAARREFERVINQNGGGDAFEELMGNLMAYRKHVGTEIVFKPANWLSKGKWRVTLTAPASRPVVDHRSRQWMGASGRTWG